MNKCKKIIKRKNEMLRQYRAKVALLEKQLSDLNVKTISFTGWALFAELYRYETIPYRLENFFILNIPVIAKVAFNIRKKMIGFILTRYLSMMNIQQINLNWIGIIL